MNNKTIAVAIDRDKGSQSALKWAVDNLVGKGQIVYLVHVKLKQSNCPFSIFLTYIYSKINFSLFLLCFSSVLINEFISTFLS